HGRVVVAGQVVMERPHTDGRIFPSDCVVEERLRINGRVPTANLIVHERFKTNGRVLRSGCEIKEGLMSFSGVLVKLVSVRWRANGSCRGRKPKTGECERNKNQRFQIG